MTARRLVPVVLALSWACVEEAAAKCGFHTYVVVGRVVAGPARAALADASILAFANGTDGALSYFEKVPPVVTDAEGTFRARYRFSSYSGGGIMGDRCNDRIRSLEVVISHRDPQVRARRFRFKGSALRVRPGPDRWTFLVDLPVLELGSPVDPRQDDGL